MGRRSTGSEENLRDKLSRRFDLLPDLLENTGLVEMRGRGSVTVRGGGRILLYTPEEIRFSLPNCVLCICGLGLVCTSYYPGAVGVDGRIDGVFFKEGEV